MEYLCNPIVFLGHFLYGYRHSLILRVPRQPRTTDTEATVFKEVQITCVKRKPDFQKIKNCYTNDVLKKIPHPLLFVKIILWSATLWSNQSDVNDASSKTIYLQHIYQLKLNCSTDAISEKYLYMCQKQNIEQNFLVKFAFLLIKIILQKFYTLGVIQIISDTLGGRGD